MSNKKTNPWQLVGEDYSVFSFEKQPELMAAYISTKTITPEDKKKKPFDLHVFVEIETGEQINVPDVYAVRNAIESTETPTLYAFKFNFEGKKEIGKGRTVNSIRAQKCLLSELEE